MKINEKEGLIMKKWLCMFSVFLVLNVVLVGIPVGKLKMTAASERSDLTKSFDVSDPLEFLREKGIMEGFEDGEMKPDNKLTRAEFAAILNRAFPDENVGDVVQNFSDLSEEHWAFEDVQKAISAGWLRGFEDGSFRPDEKITYEQALTVVCRVLNIYADEEEYPLHRHLRSPLRLMSWHRQWQTEHPEF